MPGFEELMRFREEIASLGDEKKVAEEAGGTYEELPLPKESARSASPKSGADAAVPAQSSSIEESAAIEESAPAQNIEESRAEESAATADFSGIQLDNDFDTPAGGDGLSDLDDILSSLQLGGYSDDDDGMSLSDNDFAESADGLAGDLDSLLSEGGLGAGGGLDLDSPFNDSFESESPAEQEAEKAAAEDADVISISGEPSEEPLSEIGGEINDETGGPESEDSLDNLDFDVDSLNLDDLGDIGDLGDDAELGGDFVSAGDFASAASGESPIAPANGDEDALPDFDVDGLGSLESIDLDGLGDLGTVEPDAADETPIASANEEEGDALPGIDVGGLGSLESIDLDGLGDLGAPEPDASDEGPIASANEEEGDALLDIDVDGLGSLESIDLDGLGDLGTLELDAAASDEGGLGSLEDEAAALGMSEEESEPALLVGEKDEGHHLDGLHGMDNFDFDESMLGGHSSASSAAEASEPQEDSDAAAKRARNAVPTELTEEEYRRFLYLLSRFPLNLRIATEEYLSEGSGTDEQKMALVASILRGASLRKIARTVGDYLDRMIIVPKDFEKKNFEEYQLEKSSLKYVLMNKILPVVSLAGIFIVLLCCIAFLSYQFIYRPVSAEGLYKRGYQSLEAEIYNQADELFERATERWDKRKWYFTYARGYRGKNQYIAAENMYIRLLERWNNDLEGGLEYADMLRSDLQNYERAETVLRRRVLDYHPNNLDALLLLGDVLLDWAEEDPAKYEQARLQYATAIDIYGQTDPALARMMRYFIRTNNLEEVLPLKERFMGKRAEISAADLIELGGYLLEKRYMPAPGDSDILRDAIGDLRLLLEKGLDADSTIPEGHYNLGRFWIYNYSNSRAAGYLTDAIRLFGEEERLSRRRVISYVDSYRLLGELRASEMEYIIAQELYAKGISLYEERKAARSVPQDERVGRLYADYADIDYFISNDWDAALRNYSQAVAELYDTPSIRYKIGYIYYQNEDYASALPQFVRSYSDNSNDASILYALGNTLFRRESWNAARGYYERLMEISEAERVRKGVILPQVRSDHGAFVEQYMHTANNLGVTLYKIAGQGRNASLRGRAYSLFSESARAWDALTRNPDTLISAEGTNLAYLNMQNITAPMGRYSPEIYTDIPKTLEGEKALQGRRD